MRHFCCLLTQTRIAKFHVIISYFQAEFQRLALGFKCDMFTLEKRLRLEERSRDLAEENVRREVSSCQGLLQVGAAPSGPNWSRLFGQVSLKTSGQRLEELELVELKSVFLISIKCILTFCFFCFLRKAVLLVHLYISVKCTHTGNATYLLNSTCKIAINSNKW